MGEDGSAPLCVGSGRLVPPAAARRTMMGATYVTCERCGRALRPLHGRANELYPRHLVPLGRAQ